MITAIFNDKMDSTVAYGLWQWDYGQILRIKGLELPQTAIEVHFSFEKNDGDSETIIGTTKNITYDPIIEGDKVIPAETIQVLDVPIPKNFLWNNNKKDYIICASIYISDEEMGETLKKIILPIRAKPRPAYPHASKDEELFHSTLEQVNEYAQTAIDNAQLSKSYAVGGTNTRENEDVDNAKYYAEQASTSSEEATLQADNAEQFANNAKEYEENAELSANKAKEYETSSKTNADNAEEYKDWAYEYKDNAQEYSITTREYRDEAENAKNIALQASIDTGGARDEVNRTKTQIDENIETINNQLTEVNSLISQTEQQVTLSTQNAESSAESSRNSAESALLSKQYADEAKAKIDEISLTNSDWEEANTDSPAYILNKPSIKAGTGIGSIVQGLDTIASGKYSIATGRETTASGSCSYAEGFKTIASGAGSHAEGYSSVASKLYGHAEGICTIASGQAAHTEGFGCIASDMSHAEGWNTNAGTYTANHAEGMGTSAFYGGAHAEGTFWTVPIQLTGDANTLIYKYENELHSRVIKYFTYKGPLKIKLKSDMGANQNRPNDKIANVVNIDTENKTITVDRTLSETAISNKEFEILNTTFAYGAGSHAEGAGTMAYGHGSHAGGMASYALGEYSFVSGRSLIGNAQAQTVIGTYNISDDITTTCHNSNDNVYGNYALIVGNGYYNSETDEFIYSNGYTLDWQGNGWYQGKITINGEPTEDQDVVTKKWVENKGYLTVHQDISNKADKSEIPTKISQLTNDSNFIDTSYQIYVTDDDNGNVTIHFGIPS